MKLDCSKIFDCEGESLVVEGVVDLSAIKLWGAKPFTKPVPLRARAENHAGVVTLGLSSDFSLELRCHRCLTEFHRDFSLRAQHIVVRELGGEDTGDYVVAPDGMVDLDELFTTDLVLDMPMKVLCRENCKGLCSQCGVNRNETSCECGQTTIDPRLAALSELLNEE